MYRVAVTGVGGGCGQAIVKALRMSKLPLEIFKVDITPLSAGLFFSDAGLSAVLPAPEKSLTEWEQFIDEFGIDAIIPGSDHDLLPLSIAFSRSVALVAKPSFVRIANDKAETYRTGIYAIPSIYAAANTDDILAFAEAHGFPLIVKPRNGMTSRGVSLVNDLEELLFYWKHTANPIVQKYIDGDEYTCAVYFSRRGEPVAFFQMRRWLYAGSTYRAEVTHHPIVEEFMRCTAVALQRYRPTGPVNLQMRLDANNTPHLLEINARCSGSTAMRAHFGYNEPEMLLREYCAGEDIEMPKTRDGVAMRYWDELYVDNATIEDIKGFNR